MIPFDHPDDPTGFFWSCLGRAGSQRAQADPSGAIHFDAVQPATDLAVWAVDPIEDWRSCSGVVGRLGLRLVARDLQAAGAWHEHRR
jgi:hypothetical protein